MSTCSLRHSARAAVSLLALLCLGIGMTSTPATAQEAPSEAPQLGIRPVDQPGSWYDLELSAGATEYLSVELSNHGDEPLAVASYAADVYSLVGGGMGISLRDDPTSGTTDWLDYRAATQLLRPDEAVRRTVTVAVPDDVEPGQYLAALVIQNDEPVAAEGELSVEHVVRQAIAVNITVPGPAAAGLGIGDVEHVAAGQRSVARLEILNTGNRHLKPTGTLTLSDGTGEQLASLDVTMDSVYAGTTAHLEIGVEELLAPGTYTVSAELQDSEHGVDATGTATFEVIAPPATDRVMPGVERAIDAIEATGLPTWLVLSVAALLLVLLLAVLLLLIAARRRRRSTDTAEPTASPRTPSLPVVAASDPSRTIAAPPAEPPVFVPAALEPVGQRPRRSDAGRTRDHDVSLPSPRTRTRESADTRPVPPSPPATTPPPSPARPVQEPILVGAPTARHQAKADPSSTLLFTARPASRRRRGSH